MCCRNHASNDSNISHAQSQPDVSRSSAHSIRHTARSASQPAGIDWPPRDEDDSESPFEEKADCRVDSSASEEAAAVRRSPYR